MRALVLHWGRNGGGPRFASDAVAGLRSAGVWTALSYSRQSERASLDAVVADAACPVDTFANAPGAVFHLRRAVSGGRKLRRFVEQERIDCVFAAMEQIWQPWAARSIARTEVPYLLGMHDASFHPGDGGFIAGATRRSEIRAADGLVAFSEEVASELRRSSAMPAERVWSTFLPARASTPTGIESSTRPLRFGFFGRWQPYKGLGLLVEAARAVPKDLLEVHIHGDGDDEGMLADVPANVRVHRGWTEESEVERVISGFDVLVAPYVEASQSGVVPLAAALGVPAIVTPVGGLTEQVVDGKTGLVVESTHPRALAAAMGRLAADRSLIRNMGLAAKVLHETERSPEHFGRELALVMEDLVRLGKRGGSR